MGQSQSMGTLVHAVEAGNARLSRVEFVAPPTVIGRNTVHALQSGVVYGFAGQVDGIVRRMAGARCCI